MWIEPLIPLILFALVATATPGAATTIATASGAQFGFRRSIPVMLGSACGLAALGLTSGAGLAGLLLAVPTVQGAMKLAGSAYLIWLGWKISRSGAPRPLTEQARPIRFIGGAGLLWLNPKGWAMTLSAAASFAALAGGPGQLGLLLGATFGLTALASLFLWCAAGLLLRRLLQSERQWRALNIMLGLLLVASIIPMWLE
ncbi:MAG TPA: LysE family transporter [Terriglobia bacterium]|nr:LysE family transporter [Terriglobia bacterium]